MPLSVAQLIASADTSGEALRLLRAALNLTQADLVARADGAIGADQISLIERGKRPMTSKQCTVIAQALRLQLERRANAVTDFGDGRRTIANTQELNDRITDQTGLQTNVRHRQGLPRTPIVRDREVVCLGGA